jgi:hypothetical protein
MIMDRHARLTALLGHTMDTVSWLLYDFIRALALMAVFVTILLVEKWLFSGRFRFSLRSLLAAITLFAVGLGVAVIMLRRS